jgi:predicted DNA-binding protein (MmcQ/YjbR family)
MAKARLLKYALAKPETTLEHPWGENVAKVRGKVFVFFGTDTSTEGLMGVKLTNALLYAKSLPYVEPMGYGLGKSGWVGVNAPKGAIRMQMLEEWIDESYANVAPKRVSRAAASPRGAKASKESSRTSTRRAARSSPARARPTRS